MTRKPTKRDMFGRILAIVADLGDVELTEFVTKEIALLDRKRNAPKTPTKAQLENVAIKAEILEVMDAAGEPMRATDIGKGVGITVQKAAALLRQLVTAGKVERVEDGKTVTFKVAE